MVGLHINEIWFVQLISLHESVMGVYLDVAFTCRFCGKYERIFVFFIPSNLSILTVVVEVFLCRWSVGVGGGGGGGGLCFSSEGVKFIFMYYK